MINSKLSKKSVKRRFLKLKNKKTRHSKRRVLKNMKGGAINLVKAWKDGETFKFFGNDDDLKLGRVT